MTLIKLTEEQKSLLSNGTKINMGNGISYSFYPFWIKEDEYGNGMAEIYHFNELPKELVDQIKRLREARPEHESLLANHFPVDET